MSVARSLDSDFESPYSDTYFFLSPLNHLRTAFSYSDMLSGMNGEDHHALSNIFLSKSEVEANQYNQQISCVMKVRK